MKKNDYYWLIGIVLFLIYLQFNLHNLTFFILGSMATGLVPISKMNWWKYALIELIVLGICFLLYLPTGETLYTIAAIYQLNGLAFVLITVLFSTITYMLCANLVYQLISKRLYFKTTFAKTG